MSQAPGKRAGRVLMVWPGRRRCFWPRGFSASGKTPANPNSQVQSEQGEGFIEVRLVGNGQGHFVADGAINGQVVHFMLDTGATDVAIPALARELNLERSPVTAEHRQRPTEGYRTRRPPATGRHRACGRTRHWWRRAWMAITVLLGMSALNNLNLPSAAAPCCCART
jgi:aspartyl protease family protein